jgi:hypothetical protein
LRSEAKAHLLSTVDLGLWPFVKSIASWLPLGFADFFYSGNISKVSHRRFASWIIITLPISSYPQTVNISWQRNNPSKVFRLWLANNNYAKSLEHRFAQQPDQ